MLKKHIGKYKSDVIAEIDNLIGQDRKIFFSERTEAYRNYQPDIINFFEEILSDDRGKNDA